MAELSLLQSGRVDNMAVPNAVTPQVSTPQVNYVGMKAAVEYQNTLSESLDRLSSSLFGIAKNAAQESGMQYVADNPVTPEQLEAAKRGDVSKMNVPQNSVSIYDQAVRKARAFEVSSHFEAEARNDLNVMLTAVEQGAATTEQVQQKIGTMMAGYSKSLNGVDPEASLKFRATIATMGNTVIAKAAEFEIKRQKQQQLIKFDRDFDNSVRLLEAAVSQGFWVDPKTQQVRSIDDFADVYRQTILTSSLLLGDSNIQKQYSDKFEAALKNAKINAVSAFVTAADYSADFSVGLQRLQVGDVGKMKEVFAGMPQDDKAKVIANYMVSFNQKHTIQQAQREDAKRAALASAIPLLERAWALPEGSPERASITKKINSISMSNPDAVPLSYLKDLNEPAKEGNPQVEFNVLQGIYNGTINTPEQIDKTPGLSGKQKVTLLKSLTTEDRRDQKELDNGLARLAGIPTMPGQITVIDPKGTEFKRLQGLRAEAQQIQAEATRDGKIMTPRQILTQMEGNLEKRRNTEQAKAARTQLETVYEKKAGGKITRDSLPALEKSGKLNANEIRQVKRLLDQADGDQ